MQQNPLRLPSLLYLITMSADNPDTYNLGSERELQIRKLMKYYSLEQYLGLVSVFKHLGYDTVSSKLKYKTRSV